METVGDITYPTQRHEKAAASVVDFFSHTYGVDTVLLVGSCLRGRATHDSSLEITVLVNPDLLTADASNLVQSWKMYYDNEGVFRHLEETGRFSRVQMTVTDGCITPSFHGWISGPDDFEVKIGNLVVYNVPLVEPGEYLTRLKDRWLPYYSNQLRAERLAMVRRYCLNNLQHVPLYVEQGLYFQAFDRLYKALGEFFQTLFIARRTYPIAYDKWIREQVKDILGLSELYREMVGFLEIRSFESGEISRKAEKLEKLLDDYCYD